jgi:hypothetical protein
MFVKFYDDYKNMDYMQSLRNIFWSKPCLILKVRDFTTRHIYGTSHTHTHGGNSIPRITGLMNDGK